MSQRPITGAFCPYSRYTYTLYDREGEVIAHDTAPIEGHTAKPVKHTLAKRFHLQAGGSWTCLANGTYKRSYRCPRTGERSSIILEPIPHRKEGLHN